MKILTGLVSKFLFVKQDKASKFDKVYLALITHREQK